VLGGVRGCRNITEQCALDPVPTWLVKAAGTTMTGQRFI